MAFGPLCLGHNQPQETEGLQGRRYSSSLVLLQMQVTVFSQGLEASWVRSRCTGFTSTPFRLEFLFSVLLTYRTYRSHKSMLKLSKGCKIEYFRERRDQGESSVAKTLTHAPCLYTHSPHWAVSTGRAACLPCSRCQS